MKTALTFSLLLTAALSSFAGVDLGSASSRTPYDSYMQPVKQVMSSLKGSSSSMDQVRSLMREDHGFRYSFTEPFVAASPEATTAKRAGDCKAKALWLIDRMGDAKARFVVGKTHRNSKLSHAWVLWENEGKFWILDPTNTSTPIAADKVSSNDYIPLFSWSKSNTYQHAETQTFMAGIAGKRSKNPVASDASR